MSSYDDPDEPVDASLLSLIRASLAASLAASQGPSTSTDVLQSAEHICNHSLSVSLSMSDTKNVAASLLPLLTSSASPSTAWHASPLHPTFLTPFATTAFIFTLDLLNFSFWSSTSPASSRFAIEYNSTLYTGYASLLAALHRALGEGIPITSPSFWDSPSACPDSLLEHVFRSATPEPMPLLTERIQCLRSAGAVLCLDYHGDITALVDEADHSAVRMVELLVDGFGDDLWLDEEPDFEGRRCRLLKRAQIFVADLWACFGGEGPGRWTDIDQISAFADYRIPQILRHFGVLRYAPKLEQHVDDGKEIAPHDRWEVEIRGCTVWAVELLRREMLRILREERNGVIATPGIQAAEDSMRGLNLNGGVALEVEVDAEGTVEGAPVLAHDKGRSTPLNAIMIDFLLYDLAKEKEKAGVDGWALHHRTRSIRY